MSAGSVPRTPSSLRIAAGVLLLACLADAAHSQRRYDPQSLLEFSRRARAEAASKRTAVYHRLLASTDPAQVTLNRSPGLEMMGIGPRGVPVYYQTVNLDAARTVRTWDVWPAGVGGGLFGLTGSTTLPGELALWDQGRVYAEHPEFGGRVTQMDSVATTSQHSTHVAGTLIAAGINPLARGMSYEAPLHAYDWKHDFSEMAAAAAGNLQISSHSYGHASGWENSRWYGDITVSAAEDYGFGFYDDDARDLDEIAYLAPEYLIVIAAGNDRNDVWYGTHYHWEDSTWVSAVDSHGADFQDGGYDTVNWFGNAKNPLLVGAVDDIPGGYSSPASVVMMPFSNWGPCDDGRIKPDIVANGYALLSTNTAGPASYIAFTGTSMAAPNVAGSINLIAHEFTARFGQRALSSTLKAIVIHTADEAGSTEGPDYAFGWGLLSTRRAIELVREGTSGDGGVLEGTLTGAESDAYAFAVDAAQPVRITLAWTDPPGTTPPVAVDPPDRMLVNDLDVRISPAGGGPATAPGRSNPSIRRPRRRAATTRETTWRGSTWRPCPVIMWSA
jgi:hypothetical protein